MTHLEHLKSLNPGIFLESCDHGSFLKYGKVIDGLDCRSLVDFMKTRELPAEGTAYTGSIPEMEGIPGPEAGKTWKGFLSTRWFGGLPTQAGMVLGRNSRLNALEYHKSSEIIIAGSDMILLLGRVDDIQSWRSYDASLLRGYLLREAQAVELLPETLHFAPIMTTPEGFRAGIILPAGTNSPLEHVDTGAPEEQGLLWMMNKWLIACPGSIPAGKGAVTGIDRNIEIKLA